jgi:hypothetical protein
LRGGTRLPQTPFTDTFAGPKLQPAARSCNKKRLRALPFGSLLRTVGPRPDAKPEKHGSRASRGEIFERAFLRFFASSVPQVAKHRAGSPQITMFCSKAVYCQGVARRLLVSVKYPAVAKG